MKGLSAVAAPSGPLGHLPRFAGEEKSHQIAPFSFNAASSSAVTPSAP